MATSLGSNIRINRLAGRSGPFKSSGGAFYVIANNDNDQSPVVMKATDPNSSWSRQTTNEPSWTVVNGQLYCDAVQSSDTLHMIWGFNNGTDTHYVYYASFDMSTDQWGASPELLNSVVSDVNYYTNQEYGCIHLRSDGDIICVYLGTKHYDKGKYREATYYSRYEGSTWTKDVAVSPQTSGENETLLGAVIGESDDLFITWDQNANGGTTSVRKLSSANSLSSIETATAGVYRGSAQPTFLTPIYHNSSTSYKQGLAFIVDNVTADYVAFWRHDWNGSTLDDNVNADPSLANITENALNATAAVWDSSASKLWALVRNNDELWLISATFNATTGEATWVEEANLEIVSWPAASSGFTMNIDGTLIRYVREGSSNTSYYEEYQTGSAIGKADGVSYANVGKVTGVLKANIGKIIGVE